MKKNILLYSMPILLFTITHAQGQRWQDEHFFFADRTNFYAKFLGGVNFLQNATTDNNKTTFEAGYIVSGSLGYYCPCGVRLEAEYAFRKNAIKEIDFYVEGCSRNGHLQNYSCMGNLLWNLPLSSWGCTFWHIQPFIGAGLGCDFQRMCSSNSRIIFHQKWNGLSCQAIAGLTWQIGCRTGLTLEYKFHQGPPRFFNHYVGIGLLYRFGSL
jgi:hypothetical protein